MKNMKYKLYMIIRILIMCVYTGVSILGLVGSAYTIIKLPSYYSAMTATAGLGLMFWILLVSGKVMFEDVLYYIKKI